MGMKNKITKKHVFFQYFTCKEPYIWETKVYYEKRVLSVLLGSLSTKNLKPTNNTLYLENKK